MSGITLEMNHYKKIKLPLLLKKGKRLQYSDGEQSWVLDAQWNKLKTLKVSPSDFQLKAGENYLTIDCNFDTIITEAKLKFEIKLLGKTQNMGVPTA